MRKIILILLLKGLCIYTVPVVEAQEARSSLEVLGGVGISDFTKKSKTQFLETLDGFTNDQIEIRESAFSPGLYASAEFRWIGHFDKFRFGLFIPISQYSAVFNSTTKRESLGWTHKKERVVMKEYKMGFGFNLQYSVFRWDEHHIQALGSIGVEFHLADAMEFEQEIRFHLNEEPAFYSFTESSRNKGRTLHFWNAGLGASYAYEAGRLVPFSELGFRYVGEKRDDDLPRENWKVFYLNLGLKWLIL
ncbi:MAG: hypothetical protein EA411_12615 [Saprospirales bacterium]|nr:MAG: hypothetical protein EA411_12615 [Saprospirales bacterium]